MRLRHREMYDFLCDLRMVEAQGEDFANSQEKKYLFMQEQGFEVVEYKKSNSTKYCQSRGMVFGKYSKE